MQQVIDRLIRRLPDWVRWALFLPAALLGDLASQSIGRAFARLALPNAIVPYSDEFVWRVWAPTMFVLAGTKVAPRGWFYVACLLTAIKSVVAAVNIHTLVVFWMDGGSLTEPAIITGAPVWSSIVAEVLFLGFAVLLVMMDRGIRKERTDAYTVLKF